MPDPRLVRESNRENTLQTALLLGSMGVLLLAIGFFVFGPLGALGALGLGLLMLTQGPRLSVEGVVRHFKGQRLTATQAPVLVNVLGELARRAELPAVPTLVYIPSEIPNAFAAGRRRQPIVAVTDGLLRRLAPRELAGVLAHEVGHIRNGDLKVMRAADFVTRTAGNFSFAGKMLLLFSLPGILSGRAVVSLWGILLLLAAPTVSLMMQLALSRTREFAADLAAAELTGDPLALASALRKLDVQQVGLLRQIFMPRRDPMPSYLRTHPPTDQRVAELQKLAASQRPESSRLRTGPWARQPDAPVRELGAFARPPVRRPVVVSWLLPR